MVRLAQEIEQDQRMEALAKEQLEVLKMIQAGQAAILEKLETINSSVIAVGAMVKICSNPFA